MKLLKLTLSNFKGIAKFTLDTQGGNVSVFGDNALGKTTIFDAFLWLLFDKDSQNKKDFQIKTLDGCGEVAHGLSHEVEGLFEVGGRILTLKKAYAEKWTKKRGSAKAEFTGHTTDYFINSVPSQKKEYDAFVAGISEEEIFKLLTSPTYFNERLHWQKRREILLEVCGDISDEAVIASEMALAKLPAILQGRALEDHRKVIAAKRVEINKELEKIPVRIDEANRRLPAESDMDVFTAADNAGFMKHELQEKQAELARVEGGGEIAEKRRQLAEVEGEILRLQNEQQAEISRAADGQRALMGRAKDYAQKIQGEITSLKSTLDRNKAEQEFESGKVDHLRGKWHEMNDREFTFNQESACPACGQDLPEEQLADAREKALAQHNQQKAEALEDISNRGKEAGAKLKTLQDEYKANTALMADLKAVLSRAEQSIPAIENAIDRLQSNIVNNPIYVQKLKEQEQLEKAIAQLQAGSNETAEGVRKEIADLNAAITGAENALAMIKQREGGLLRINELKAQEKTLAAEYERLESELYLTEQFIRTKVALLEDKINSRFKYARFKMFDTQINGGITECCETLFQGVPYSGGLNNAARINVGLDIIGALSEYYGFTAPIFIDNREAVTRLIETTGQLISLVVSEPDKGLRVERDAKQIKEAV